MNFAFKKLNMMDFALKRMICVCKMMKFNAGPAGRRAQPWRLRYRSVRDFLALILVFS